MIQFYEIPSTLRKPGPYGEYNTRLSNSGLPTNVQKILLVGPKLSTGSAVADTVSQMYSDDDAATLYGPGSVMHRMARAVLLANPYARLYGVSFADAGSKAACDLTVTGTTASTAGVIKLRIGNDLVQVDVAAGTAATAVITAVAAAINARTDLPLTAAGGTGKVVLTAKHGGTTGNMINAAVATTGMSGVTLSVPAALSGGDGDPTIGTTLTKVAGERWHVFCLPYSDSTAAAALKSHLTLVSGPIEQRPGVGVVAFVGSTSSAKSLSSGIALNRMVIPFVKAVATPAYEIAAATAGVIASQEDPALPYNTRVLTGCAAPAAENGLTRTEQEDLLTNGVTPLEATAGGDLAIVRVVSTETTGASAASPDLWIRILDYVRDSVNTRFRDQFSQSKLNDRIVKAVRAMILDVLIRMEIAEIVESVELYKDRVVVERDENDPNRINARIPTDIVNGLQVMASSIELYL